MKKKNIKKELFFILVIAICIPLIPTFNFTNAIELKPVMADTIEDPIDDAIEAGLAWLAEKQNIDGSWGLFATGALTGFVVLKFESYAIELGKDPLDPGYSYYDQVRNGLNYVFSITYTTDISTQPAGNPDGDDDLKGAYIIEETAGRPTYQTSIGMMAIASSCHPEMEVDVSSSEVNGWTYEQVLQDMVDYIAFGQIDEGGIGRGGWGYEPNAGYSDNSNSGYAVLGLGYAESSSPFGFGLAIPDFVKDELNIWVDYIQDVDGGSGYHVPTYWKNILKTGNLLYEMAFVGDTTETQRVLDAIDYIETNWYSPDYSPGWIGPGPEPGPSTPTPPPDVPPYPDWPACYQAMYTTMKGFEALDIDHISPLNDPSGIDWFDYFVDVILNQQNPDGSWPNAPLFGNTNGEVYTWSGMNILSTVWALLTLEKIVAIPTQQVFVDIKPCSWPNPINLKSNGKLPIAICGAEDFDVMSIDPMTIQLYLEDIIEGVSPIRWVYKDVATPYLGPEGGGHSLGGDGFIDLVMHFNIQDVISVLGLSNFEGEIIPLMIKGNLNEENGGIPIKGQDYVWILGKHGKNPYTIPGTSGKVPLTSTFKIGLLTDMNDFRGIHAWEGALLAAKEINEAGGIIFDEKNYYIGLVAENTHEGEIELDISKGVVAANKMISIYDPDIIMGGFRTEAVYAYVEIVMDAKIPFLSTGCSNDFFTQNVLNDYQRYKYFFRVMPVNSTQLGTNFITYVLYMAYILDSILGKDVNKVALIHEDLEWTVTLTNALRVYLPYYGIEIVNDLTIPITATEVDFFNYWNQIEASGAQITIHLADIIGPLLGKTYGIIQPQCLPIGINVQAESGSYWNDTEGGCQYEITMQSTCNTSKTPLTIPFWNKYFDTYNHEPSYTGVGSYDAVNLLTHVINEIQTFNPDIIVSTLENIDTNDPFTGISGNIVFTQSHDLLGGYPYSYPLFCQRQEDGTKAVLTSGNLIYPESLATGSIIIPPWGINY